MTSTQSPANETLIITGMHRSGTSLTAALLQNLGIDVGERLMKGNISNQKGYFEDLDFVEFHESVLEAQGIRREGWTMEKNIALNSQQIAQAKSLIQSRSNKKIWGCKDPRATLFLEMWNQLIPNAKFILVYRSPWEVVDSLYRRGDDFFIAQPDVAVNIWTAYNQAILDFYQKFSHQCLLLNVNTIIHQCDDFIALLQNKFKLDLPNENSRIHKIYDQNLLKQEVSQSYYPLIIQHYCKDAIHLYYYLEKEADIKNNLELSFSGSISLKPEYKQLFFRDWCHSKKLSNLQLQVQETKNKFKSILLKIVVFNIFLLISIIVVFLRFNFN